MLKFVNLKKLTLTSLLGIVMASTLASKPASANNAITVTIEAPRIQASQLPATGTYVVDFNDKSGIAGFTKTNITTNIDGTNTTTNYVYGGDLNVVNPDQWGGASNSKYITQATGKTSFKVNINQDQKYFGFWWSAGDAANKIIFKNDGQDIAVFETKDLTNFIKNSGIPNSSGVCNGSNIANTNQYCGNPNKLNTSGGHNGEPFAYVNVFFNNEVYDEIVVQTLTTTGAKFESDNHTFSAINQPVRGTAIPQLATAMTDLISTSEDNGMAGNVITNDLGVGLSVTKINGDATKIGQQVTLASGALVTLNSNGTFTYNPNSKFESLNPNQTATDTFSYTIKDNQNNISTATVTTTIDGAADNPVAIDDTSTTDEDTIKWMPVLVNDSDPNTVKQDLTITKINNTVVSGNSSIRLNSGATVQVWENSDSSKHSTQGKYILKYDPTPSSSLNALNEGNTGTEIFTYTVSDPQGNTSQGSVTVTIDGITDTPD